MTSSDSVFHPEAVRELEAKGLLVLPVNGKRKISVIVESRDKLDQVDDAHTNHREPEMGNNTIQLALINRDKHGDCIAVVDRI